MPVDGSLDQVDHILKFEQDGRPRRSTWIDACFTIVRHPDLEDENRLRLLTKLLVEISMYNNTPPSITKI